MGQYEDNNLKQYTGTRYENFLLFRHPQKTEAKDILESLVLYHYLFYYNLAKRSSESI